ncbi:N-acetylmuramoyl-L-alanine amidase-like domain-containing protein [Massilia brevitalea]|uniref:N-acetylmuramoyl-L-alanine amidase-like domain-containing protein n=1 Tax=Massilia brevitalea TaxID=442526 RepID=UPI0027388913|nr:N-acetylmuramoyl-L-alanine amidase-like domain-containing protein [Massilia brevitalea]
MRFLPLLLAGAVLAGCATPPAPKTAQAPAAPVPIETILQKPLYRMSPVEAGRYVAWQHAAEPDLRKRIAAIGRKNIGQPYILNLLGEFPFEVHDNLPLFSLDHSDCVVFAEHTYAMALSRSWEEFFWMLQRIRYKDGVIGVATRNHYTELDWNVSNRWLVTDISAGLAGANGPGYDMRVDRARFLETRHNTVRAIPVETSRQAYVPKESVAAIAAQLQEGDFVNVISTRDGAHWASHVGLVVLGPNGERHFLHSSEPQVREETFDAYIARAAEREAKNAREGKNGQHLAGFKFLRLNEDIVVPPMAPQPRPGA